MFLKNNKMKNRIWICSLMILGITLMLSTGCRKDDEEPNKLVYDTITDIEGNMYKTIVIGTQTWMAENLKTTKYGNGDLIGTTTPATLDISSEATPKYQWASGGYEEHVEIYGRLYSWYAVTDSRNVCPNGWHVPTDAEWTILTDYLTTNGYGYQGSGNDIGKCMAATSGWFLDQTAGNIGNNQASNNSSGFTALPGGYRYFRGSYLYNVFRGYWWSSTGYSTTNAFGRRMHFSYTSVFKDSSSMCEGLAIRCLKDL